MKFKKILSLMIICMFLLTGCNSDKKYNEYMANGEQAVKQEQYEYALDYFESALTEKDGDIEATSLHAQVEKLLQVQAKIKNKLYDNAIELCDEIIQSQSNSSVCKNAAQNLKAECEKLKEEQENLTFKEEIEQKISEAKKLMQKEEYMNAKTKLRYVIDEISGNSDYIEELKECNRLLKNCNDMIDEIAKKEEASKQENMNSDTNIDESNNIEEDEEYYGEQIDFNDELKKQIAVAGAAYVEFYFEYGDEIAPSAFAQKAYEDTENDTPLGEYKEQGRTIFMNAFKEAYEQTGNEYY